MKTAVVRFDNDDTITTGINGTDDEIREYYKVGKVFNLGHNGDDLMARVVSVEVKQENQTKEAKTMNGCDYGHEVKAVRLDTGGHSGIFLCSKHWAEEMKWRKLRNEELEDVNKFDILPYPNS